MEGGAEALWESAVEAIQALLAMYDKPNWGTRKAARALIAAIERQHPDPRVRLGALDWVRFAVKMYCIAAKAKLTERRS